MIARPAFGAHVCLRCQLWLSEQLSHASTVSSRISTPRGARQVHDEASSQASEAPAQVITRREGIKSDIIYRHVYRSNKVSERPMGRLHGYKGRQLREKHQPLVVDTLGHRSEVIVLRDSGLIYSPPPEMDELVAEKVDILARVEAERGLPSQIEVEANINEIRPEGQLLSTEEFKSVEQQLNDGFTTMQLARYVQSLSQNAAMENSPAQPPKHAIWTLGWMPGVSPSQDVFDDEFLRGYISAAYTPKQRLVLHILRRHWKIEAIDVFESLGEIELHIDSRTIELLIKGNNSPLRIVSDDLISTEDEKIEAIRKRSVIRITAGRAKADLIVQAIQEKLRKFCSIELDLTPILPAPEKKNSIPVQDDIGGAEIAELARLSGTEIKKLEGNKVEISCINDDHDLHLSTQIDVARRFLLTSSDVWHNTFRQFRFPTSTGPISAVKYEQIDGMSWRDRLHSWVRWVSPLPKATSNEVVKEQKGTKVKAAKEKIRLGKSRLTDEDQLPFPIAMSQKELDERYVENVVSKPRGYVFWDHKYFTTTSIIVGHVLHKTESGVATTTKPSDGTMRFVPSTLNVSKLFGRANQNHLQERSSVVMKFRPSPWTEAGKEALKKFPQVEMRFQINPKTKLLELNDVFALSEVATSDIMVPDRGLDLRFQQRTTSRLRELHYRTLPQIKEFLAVSQLNVMHGPLKTPPSIMFPIAQHLTSLEMPPKIIEAAGAPSDVEYLFAGLEYRNTLAVPFGNWRLLYTSIDGGKAEGCRTELSLRPRRSRRRDDTQEQRSPDWHDVQTQDFIDTAYKLLDVLEDGNDPIRRVNAPKKVRRVESSRLEPMRGADGDAFHGFKYFNRTVTFTAAPSSDALTTPKTVDGEGEGEGGGTTSSVADSGEEQGGQASTRDS